MPSSNTLLTKCMTTFIARKHIVHFSSSSMKSPSRYLKHDFFKSMSILKFFRPFSTLYFKRNEIMLEICDDSLTSKNVSVPYFTRSVGMCFFRKRTVRIFLLWTHVDSIVLFGVKHDQIILFFIEKKVNNSRSNNSIVYFEGSVVIGMTSKLIIE